MEIPGNVALIAGGASGLGRAAAHRLATAGAHVVILDLPSSRGGETAAEIGDTAEFVHADVTSADDVTRAVDAAAARGPLRIVVNCAGVGTPGRVLARGGVIGLRDFVRVVETNLIGTFNVLRLAAERVAGNVTINGERGVIVNTASIAAFDGQVGQAAYAASKGGVLSMMLPIAREFAALEIRVMTVAPGLFETPLLDSLPRAAQDSLAGQVPHPRRLGHPSEYAALVEHIIRNPMLNGEVIRLDGALRMAPR